MIFLYFLKIFSICFECQQQNFIFELIARNNFFALFNVPILTIIEKYRIILLKGENV